MQGAVPVNCAAGVPLGNLQFDVAGDPQLSRLPLRGMNRLGEGDRIYYTPGKLRVNPKGGEVALVLAPAPLTAAPGTPLPKDVSRILVLDPMPANKPAEWSVPFRVGVVALVYGPEGVSTKKVKAFLSQDEDLITQLADYADKTAQTEALLTALSTWNPNNTNDVDAALNGFGSQYGITAGIDRTLPRDQQMLAVMRTINPSLAGVDPVSTDSSQRTAQSAALATSVAGMFFGSGVGLAASGAALFMNLRSMMFPNTEFRSSFAVVSSPPTDKLELCGKREALKPRTKVAYLWAERLPNMGPPEIKAGSANHLPIGQKSPFTVTMNEGAWKVVDRAHDWKLVNPETKATYPVKVKGMPAEKSLEVDLNGVPASEGKYGLQAGWDWNTLQVDGEVWLQPLSTFSERIWFPPVRTTCMSNKEKQWWKRKGQISSSWKRWLL